MADDAPLRSLVPRASELYDHRLERAVLAAALLDAEGAARVIPRVAAIVTAEDFHHPAHGMLWEVFLTVHGRGDPVDVLTVVAELRVRERLHTIGGAAYVGELTDEIPTLAHCEAHARLVHDFGERRRALALLADAGTRLARGDALAIVLETAQKALRGEERAAGALRVGAYLDRLQDAMLARYEGRERAVPTPWPCVDRALGGGLWPGMYVLVGGTGAGKTQWAVQLAVSVARAGARVLYLALELSELDVTARVVGDLAGVAWSSILRGTLQPPDFDAVSRGFAAARELALHIECGAPFGYGAEMLAQRAWALRPALVVLDYLQVCGGRPGEDARTMVARVSYLARQIARDLGAVVLVLSSTARTNYAELVSDPEKDPSDLVGLGKESGEIEYAADGVLVLARHANKAEKPRTRVLVVAKNRHGPLGTVELEWSGTAFTEQAEEMTP